MPVTFELVDVATVDNPIVGDIKLTNGSYRVIGDAAATFSGAVAQTIRNRLLFFQGEWFLDSREGLPWIQSILVKSPDLSAIRSLFRKVIGETAGVTEVVSIDLAFDRNARVLTLNFKANLTDGTVLDSREFAPFLVEV